MEASNPTPDQQPSNPISLPSLAEELLQSSEIIEAVREELKHTFYEGMEGTFAGDIQKGWGCRALKLTDPTTAPQLRVLFDYFCNKSTILYYLAATKRDYQTQIISACIYKQWFQCHNRQPNFQYGRFFCHPVQVFETGPDSISRLLQIHASLCAQANSLHDRLCRGEIIKNDTGKRVIFSNPKNYIPLPLCRAIVTVFDGFKKDFVNVKEQIHQETLLLILTGDTSGLSAPVSFDSIKAECLPLELSKLKIDTDVDIVRVTIGAAVKFVTDLEKREEAAYPDTFKDSGIDMHLRPFKTHLEGEGGDGGQYRTADDFADAYLRVMEKNGLGAHHTVDRAVRGVLTKRRGEVWPLRAYDNWLGRNAEGPPMDSWD